MTKILLVGDIHVSDKPPVSCTETYTDDIIEMLKWIAGYAALNEITTVVWAGDVFDHKAPSKNSHALILKMIGVVNEYRNLGIDLWIVPGNHDISNDRLESIHEKQPLGVLYAAGALELVGWHPTLPLYGVGWQQDWETHLNAAFYSFKVDAPRMGEKPDKCLAVTHASIFPPKIAEGVPYEHLPAADVAHAMGNAGSLYYGHIHDYHGIYEVGGVTFANVGAISRGSLTESNASRKVMVATWENGIFSEVEVPHKPASEVYRLDAVLAERSAAKSLDNFLAHVGQATLEIATTASVIDHIKTMAITPSVKALAIKYLEDADRV